MWVGGYPDNREREIGGNRESFHPPQGGGVWEMVIQVTGGLRVPPNGGKLGLDS